MTFTQAESRELEKKLVDVLMSNFQGPPIQVWIEHLSNLNPGRVFTTIQRLPAVHEPRYLSIATFLKYYQATQVDDASTRGPVCLMCGGDGWVQARDHVVLNKAGEVMHTNTQCEPCTYCDEGARRAESPTWKGRQ